MRKAIGYTRVSTKAQDEADKYGRDAQREAIDRYAQENGFTIVKWIDDVGSGTDDTRRGINQIVYGDISNPPFEAIIVFKNDRFARDTKQYFYFLYQLEKKGIKLIATEEEFDGDEGLANVYRTLLQYVAEQERKNIALRTSKGREVKSQLGGYAGGRPPYGYRTVDRKLIIDEQEASVVRTIFTLRRKGLSYGIIANTLIDMGVRNRKEQYFSKENLFGIVNNEPLYRGYYRYGKGSKWINGIHKPILNPDEPFITMTKEEFIDAAALSATV